MTRSALQLLWERQGGRCANRYCRISLERAHHIDHKRPKSKDGSDDLANLQLLCPVCNEIKRDLNDRQFLRYFPRWRRQFLVGRFADGRGREEWWEEKFAVALATNEIPEELIPRGLDGLSRLLLYKRLLYFQGPRDQYVIAWREVGRRPPYYFEVVGVRREQWEWALHQFARELKVRLRPVAHRNQLPWAAREWLNHYRKKQREQLRRQSLAKSLSKRAPSVTETIHSARSVLFPP